MLWDPKNLRATPPYRDRAQARCLPVSEQTKGRCVGAVPRNLDKGSCPGLAEPGVLFAGDAEAQSRLLMGTACPTRGPSLPVSAVPSWDTAREEERPGPRFAEPPRVSCRAGSTKRWLSNGSREGSPIPYNHTIPVAAAVPTTRAVPITVPVPIPTAAPIAAPPRSPPRAGWCSPAARAGAIGSPPAGEGRK